MIKKTHKIIITVILSIIAVAALVFVEILHIRILADETANRLLLQFAERTAFILLIGWIIFGFMNISLFTFNRQFFKYLLWSLPCFFVAIVNFPFSSLINHDCYVRFDYRMAYYILYILSIAVLEEIVFRGIVQHFFFIAFEKSKLRHLLTILVTNVLFGIVHLFNIFDGGSIPYILLQVLYTFLFGSMLSIVQFKTKNVCFPILIHAIFDFGGLLVMNLGHGEPWDKLFWILTISIGILCAGHVIVSLINLERKKEIDVSK